MKVLKREIRRMRMAVERDALLNGIMGGQGSFVGGGKCGVLGNRKY